MKFNVFFMAAVMAILAAVVVAAADQAAAVAVVSTPTEALAKVQELDLPDGVTLTGTTEKIDPPTSVAAAAKKSESDTDHKKEQLWGLGGFGLGLGGWGLGGGWGSWGGWGGLGPYRFGFMCGGVPGWAFPLGYWNAFGAGLYGGGCGLGVPFGGLYYC
jgi:hypothetical protein